jgi:succinate dehydrogenase/fumarate reductase flavoprotein subunit
MVAMAAASGAHAEESASSSTDSANDQSADLVVVGEGMGGLCAGMRALQNGVKSVTIVEVSKWAGGGSSFSLGAIHAFGMGSTEEQYLENTRYQSTSQLAIDSFLQMGDLLEWIGSLGLPIQIQQPSDANDNTGGQASDMPSGHFLTADGRTGLESCVNFFTEFENLFVSNGGVVLHGVSGRKILTDELGNITGLSCVDSDGNVFSIATTQIVLACGGWQNDQEFKSHFLGHDAWQTGCMGTPYNTGSGIKMARELGASLQGDFGHFAGLFLPALPAKNFMEDVEAYENGDYTYDEGGKWWVWREIVDFIPTHAILVNNEGKRFCDEGRYRHSYEPSIAKQTHATAIIICDDDEYQNWLSGASWGLAPDATMQDRFDTITSEEVGGAMFAADTLEDLADQMNATGVATYALHKANFLATIEEYNAAAEAGTGADLDPERVTNEMKPIVTPPFHALPIRNAIFAVFGGLAIDEQARVLDDVRRPIAGLYATEPCAGGMMQEFYSGSIAHAGVTGMWAGDAAAAALGVSA